MIRQAAPIISPTRPYIRFQVYGHALVPAIGGFNEQRYAVSLSKPYVRYGWHPVGNAPIPPAATSYNSQRFIAGTVGRMMHRP